MRKLTAVCAKNIFIFVNITARFQALPPHSWPEVRQNYAESVAKGSCVMKEAPLQSLTKELGLYCQSFLALTGFRVFLGLLFCQHPCKAVSQPSSAFTQPCLTCHCFSQLSTFNSKAFFGVFWQGGLLDHSSSLLALGLLADLEALQELRLLGFQDGHFGGPVLDLKRLPKKV